MNIIVMKFGGTSVADIDRIERAADKVLREYERGNRPAVVVSAMSGVTNQLVGWVNQIGTDNYDPREYDAVVATGEQVTAGLLAMALQKRGLKSRSWQGWQAGVRSTGTHGKARIQTIDGAPLIAALNAGEIPVVTGFQGITPEGRITTLGRGGSDTSAVALAAALKAHRCDIYTDVEGVFTTDPRIVPTARKLKRIAYEEMMELASVGAKVLQIRSVELAMKRGVTLQVLSSMADTIGSDYPGTILVKEDNMLESQVISGVTLSRDEAKITLLGLTDTPGIAARAVRPLAEAGINIDMIVQNTATDNKTTDLTFTLPQNDLKTALMALEASGVKPRDILANDLVSKVTLVGIGMRANPDIALRMFETLAAEGINISVISTSEIKISVLIDAGRGEDAVRALHKTFGLDDIDDTPQLTHYHTKDNQD